MDDPIQALLRALNIQMGMKDIVPRKNTRIEDIVAGQEILTEFGAVYAIEKSVPYDQMHGVVKISIPAQVEMLHSWAGVNTSVFDLLFFDLETTGLSGGSGTLPFLIGFGYFSQTSFEIRQLFLRASDPEPAQLVEFLKFVTPRSCLVSYNGKSFDAPILKNRLILNRFPAVLDSLQHMDLLHLARKIWKYRLESRGLKDLERDILHFERNADEIPGWMVPEVYAAYVRNGETDLLSGVISHNYLDVLSLAGIYIHLAKMFSDTRGYNEYPTEDQYSIAKAFRVIGQNDQAEKLFDLSVKSGLGEELTADAFLQKAAMAKSNGDLIKYEEYCQKAAFRGSPSALLQLTIFYEHVRKEYQLALQFAQLLLQAYTNRDKNAGVNKKKIENLNRRITRLNEKIKLSAQSGSR